MVRMLQMDELHVKGARQVDQFSRQNQAPPGMADFSDLEIVFAGKGCNHSQVFLGCSVLMGKLLPMFAHGVMRSARAEHERNPRLLLRIDGQIHRFSMYEMIDFADRHIPSRGHANTCHFLILQRR
jgi:hypothetical protein